MAQLIYKICDKDLWRHARGDGLFKGAEIDLKDGFIHFSTAEQLAETASKHFSGRANLVLLEIDGTGLNLQWEVSRGGQLFPHLYDSLDISHVTRIWALTSDEDGNAILPDLR